MIAITWRGWFKKAVAEIEARFVPYVKNPGKLRKPISLKIV